LTVITVQGVGEKWIFSSSSRSFGYGNEAVWIRVNSPCTVTNYYMQEIFYYTLLSARAKQIWITDFSPIRIPMNFFIIILNLKWKIHELLISNYVTIIAQVHSQRHQYFLHCLFQIFTAFVLGISKSYRWA
jgi:hypothetical protein